MRLKAALPKAALIKLLSNQFNDLFRSTTKRLRDHTKDKILGVVTGVPMYYTKKYQAMMPRSAATRKPASQTSERKLNITKTCPETLSLLHYIQ